MYYKNWFWRDTGRQQSTQLVGCSTYRLPCANTMCHKMIKLSDIMGLLALLIVHRTEGKVIVQIL